MSKLRVETTNKEAKEKRLIELKLWRYLNLLIAKVNRSSLSFECFLNPSLESFP